MTEHTTERDDFEDVLNRFRPVGPPVGMQLPEMRLGDPASMRRSRSPYLWLAAGVVLGVGLASGAVWMRERSASASEDAAALASDRLGTLAAGAEAPESQGRTIRISGDISAPRKTRDVRPTYSVDPGVGPVGILDLTVNANGKVQSVQILDGQSPAIYDAARAASQWEYQPMQIGGEAVSFVMTVMITNPTSPDAFAEEEKTRLGRGMNIYGRPLAPGGDTRSGARAFVGPPAAAPGPDRDMMPGRRRGVPRAAEQVPPTTDAPSGRGTQQGERGFGRRGGRYY